jgi:hypothetical protein
MTTSRLALTIDLGKDSISCTAGDLEATFAWLLAEMRSVAKVLRADERDLMRKIMTHTGPPLTVKDLFPAFTREGEPHKTLRRLRATQFIYPQRTGRWEPAEPVAVTPFARVVWDQLGEAGLFPPTTVPAVAPSVAPVIPPAPSVTPSAEPPVTQTPRPKPVTWDNLLECVLERQAARAASAAAKSGDADATPAAGEAAQRTGNR